MQQLIGRCRNIYGPLSAGERRMLHDLLRNHTRARWDRCCELIISVCGDITTLWDAWVMVDPKAPRRRNPDGSWPAIPDSFTLRRAILMATDITRFQLPGY